MIVLRRKATETLGWYGVAAVLGSYAAVNLGWMALDGAAYQIFNFTGALALIADSWPDRNWQIVALNFAWAAVAVIAILT